MIYRYIARVRHRQTVPHAILCTLKHKSHSALKQHKLQILLCHIYNTDKYDTKCCGGYEH